MNLQLFSLTIPLPRLALGALIVCYLVLAVAFSEIIPFNKGQDEGVNLDYIEFIATSGRLPVSYEERALVGPKANWPALYHLLVAGLSNLLQLDIKDGPDLKIFWDSFRYRAIDTQTDQPWFLLTEDQVWPYYGRILVLHLGRWLSILFSASTLVLVYLTTLELLPRRPWLGLIATALLGFIPTFIFIGSSLNEDALVALLAALYFWLLVRIIKWPEIGWPYWVLGFILGLSVTVKYTTVVLPLEVLLVFAVMARQRSYGWPWWGQQTAIVGGMAVLGSGWWFGWNLWFLNEVEELGLASGLLRPIFTGGTDVTLARMGNFFSGGEIGLDSLPANTNIGTFPEWLSTTFASFWGVGIGRQGIPFTPYVYLGLALMLGLVGFGLWRLWQANSEARPWLILMGFHTALFVVLPLVRFGLSRRLGQTAQGRHILIPAATAIVILIVWGIATAIPRHRQHWVFITMIAGFVGWTGLHLYRLDTFEATLLPMRTVAQAAAWLPHPIHAQFGETAELVSYDLIPQPEQGLVQVTLGWQALAYTNESYLVQVRLIDAAGQVVSDWTGYNGQGRLPTLAWDPGDTIFDRLTLPLPNLPAGEYGVYVQMLQGDTPLDIQPAANRHSGEATAAGSVSDKGLLLTNFSLTTPSNLTLPHRFQLDTPQGPVEVNFALWGADGPAETISNPVYRYPGTITVVTSPAPLNGAVLKLELVDESGQTWPARSGEANLHTFIIGPRWASGPYRLQMTLQSEAGVIAQASTEPLLSVENWWERRFELPDIPVRVEANFADQIMLLGYKLPQPQVKAGEAFPLTLYWQAPPDKSPQADFIQFNNLLSSSGTLYGGYDRHPLEYYNTLLWAPGEVVIDGYTVPVAEDAPPGEYYLDVGYYLMVGESAVNLPLVVDGQMTDVSSVTIGPIEVIKP